MRFFKKRPADAEPVQAVVPAEPAQEARARIGQQVLSSSPQLGIEIFGLQSNGSSETVTIESALGVPAVWAAVNFLSDTLASLPIKAYERTDKGARAMPEDEITDLFNHAASDEMDAFAWRRGFWQDVFTAGRHVSFIEGAAKGTPKNLWPLEIARTRVRRSNGRTFYNYDDYGRPRPYAAADVLDLSFMPGADRLGSRSPIYTHAATIGLAQAVARYGTRFFDNGGVPPFAVSGPLKTPGGVERAGDQLTEAVVAAAQKGGNAIALPEGHTLTPIGADPERSQMVDTRRFLIEEIARIYGLPPVFLQDLTHGTFSNTEQQDLQLVKHCIARWANAKEKQANLKIYGRGNRQFYLEHNLEGLMRGDLKSRAEAIAQKINSGQVTLNEARALDNRPELPGGNSLLVQGAMVPAESLQTTQGETE